MNRTIKFRGKRSDTGEWVYGFFVAIAGTHKICAFSSDAPGGATWYDVDPNSVGQSTGCIDSLGVEIFEGDIIQRDGCEDSIAEVMYNDDWTGYFGVGNYRANGQIGWMIKNGYHIEVIGNATDSPKLLRND